MRAPAVLLLHWIHQHARTQALQSLDQERDARLCAGREKRRVAAEADAFLRGAQVQGVGQRNREEVGFGRRPLSE